MKQGQCICPLSWSVHCNFTGEGAPPTLTSQDWFYPHHWMYARKQRLQLCVLCAPYCISITGWRWQSADLYLSEQWACMCLPMCWTQSRFPVNLSRFHTSVNLPPLPLSLSTVHLNSRNRERDSRYGTSSKVFNMIIEYERIFYEKAGDCYAVG